MSTIRRILAAMLAAGLLASCDSGNDSYLEEFLSKQNTHWTEIKYDVDTPGPDRPEGYKGLNKQGYYSGALMGNGLIGTNMYKAEAPDTYRLNVGRSDVTEQREGYDLYKKGRLPIGYFTLKTVGNVTAEEMDLSIYDAQTTGTFTTDKGSIAFKTYVHAIEDYIVFETTSKGEETGFKWDFVPFKAVSPRIFNGKTCRSGTLILKASPIQIPTLQAGTGSIFLSSLLPRTLHSRIWQSTTRWPGRRTKKETPVG
ncbi:MAG: hypothetical protein J6N46_07005 [Bacteroidales bacterium]|nr:hypothetical protein [Bacteroidales bacterium]MBO6221667.1 hypothetical protein [Bacteroidales bacterium]